MNTVRTDAAPETPHRADESQGTAFESTVIELRSEVDCLDTEILAAVIRRSNLARHLARARGTNGNPELVYTDDVDVFRRFDDLGQEGRTLAALVLQLSAAGRRDGVADIPRSSRRVGRTD